MGHFVEQVACFVDIAPLETGNEEAIVGDDVESREVVFQDLLGFGVELFSGQVQQ